MTENDNTPVFDVAKMESLDVESKLDLRSARPQRRSKKANPNQFDLFSQFDIQPQEPRHDEHAATISTEREIHDKQSVRQRDGAEDSGLLAREQSATGGRPDPQTNAEPDSGADGKRLARPSDRSGKDAETPAELGGDGSVADHDAPAGNRRRERGRQSQRDGSVSLAVIDEDVEPSKPSHDYRITAETRLGEGSLRDKAQANLDAIKLLKQIELEGRSATDDEKHILARYSGWGAMPAAFDFITNKFDGWNILRDELRDLLTYEEHRAASASVNNAHFTSPLVIKAIWTALERMGVKAGARVLEPSMGVGNFFGLMPEHLMPKALRAGVELDSITARIAKLLYQDATIFETGFQQAPFPDGFFDVAVGNVPFGNYGVHDAAYKSWQTASIHNYFIIKTLDKLRDGGILALITSRYTMDEREPRIREHLASKADLLGAIRLPNTSFKDNAGTIVTTDILFLKKRPQGQEAAPVAWTETQEYAPSTDEDAFSLNQYYVDHPQMMLGRMRVVQSRYAPTPELLGDLTEQNLQAAIEQLPQDTYVPRLEAQEAVAPPPQIIPDESLFTGVKNGAFLVVDNIVVQKIDNQLVPFVQKAKTLTLIRSLIKIRDATREVLRTQLANTGEEEIVAARQSLNYLYDRFVSENGALSSKQNRTAFQDDPDAPLLLSLESDYDEATGKAKKAAIFSRRTLERYEPVESAETASEALAITLNEYGRIEWSRMSALTGKTRTVLQRELDGLVYEIPETGNWETADAYLSGNVREKLIQARNAADMDKSYQRNVKALEGVQPTDLAPQEILLRLGATWIPRDDLADFVAAVIDAHPRDVRVDYMTDLSAWTVTIKDSVKDYVGNKTTYGTTRFTATNLIEDALNGVSTTAYDTKMVDGQEKRFVNEIETIAAREMQQRLKDKFVEWAWSDEERTAQLTKIYNEKFNSIRLRSYDGSHLTFPNMNKALLRDGDLAPHQKNAVWRILQGDNTLLAHCVGAGKTWVMTAAAMEAKRIGLAKKSMMVVPNHLVDQWGAAFLQLYPQANILVIGSDQFKAGKRQRAMSRIATGNYDAVIVSHRSFELLPVSDDLFDKYMAEQMESLEQAIRDAEGAKSEGIGRKSDRRIVKMLAAAKKRLAKKIEDRAKREKKDKTIGFEELGIDRIFVDEADEFKNLGFITKMTRIAGLQNSNANRSTDLHIKTRWMYDQYDGKGVVFATGTPVSNTMAELYTMQRYLAPKVLEAAGMVHFDAWAANFGEAVTGLELSPSGSGYRMHTRFARFINLPELLVMFRDFADVQTAEMLDLPRPALVGGKPRVVTAPASLLLKSFVEDLVKRAEAVKSGSVSPDRDNMLKITSAGRLAALDMRLVHPMARENPTSKVSLATKEIHAIWKRTEASRSTQLVFCDLSTPRKEGFNVYGAVRMGLIGLGVPPHEIAFIQDAKTDADKQALFEKVNSGKIRILLGSTKKMGAGTNVQKKLVALHHLDAPWRPRDIEQRNGRILRQGNENGEVEIINYVTEGSFDAYMWQTLETKAKFINQVMNGDTSVRVAEDLEGSALTYAEIKAIASGNPAVMEKVKVDTEIRKLDALKTAYIRRQAEIKNSLNATTSNTGKNKEQITKVQADIKTRDKNKTEEFAMTVAGQPYTGKDAREKAAIALDKSIIGFWENGREAGTCGQISGFDIVCRRTTTNMVSAFLRGEAVYAVNFNPENPIGTIMSIEHALRGFETVESRLSGFIETDSKAVEEYHAQLGKPFEHDDRLKQLLAQQALLNVQLDLDKGDKQTTTLADNDNDGGKGQEREINDEDVEYLDPSLIISVEAPTSSDNDNAILRPTGTLAPTPK